MKTDARTTGHAWVNGRCVNCDAEESRPWAETCPSAEIAPPGCTCGLAWRGHPNPHEFTCPLHSVTPPAECGCLDAGFGYHACARNLGTRVTRDIPPAACPECGCLIVLASGAHTCEATP